MRAAALLLAAAGMAACRDAGRATQQSVMDSARDVTLAARTATAPRVVPRVDVSPCIALGDTITLGGRLTRLTFPGPPNYESVAGGDEAETGYYLRLDPPSCARDPFPATDDPDMDARDSVRLVQLILDAGGYARLRPRLGQMVELRGPTISAHTGHHHAPILLDLLGVTGTRNLR